jgi:hypothetical protein
MIAFFGNLYYRMQKTRASGSLLTGVILAAGLILAAGCAATPKANHWAETDAAGPLGLAIRFYQGPLDLWASCSHATVCSGAAAANWSMRPKFQLTESGDTTTPSLPMISG